MDCHMDKESCTGNASTARETELSDITDILPIIYLPCCLILLLLCFTATIALVFALSKAKKNTFTAVVLRWLTYADVARIVLTYIPCISSAVGKRWLLGNVVCTLFGYVTKTTILFQTILLLLLSIIRYLAMFRPCLQREASLYQAGKVGVCFSFVTSLLTAALPFLASPNYGYIAVMFRCDMISGWASKVTTVLFMVFPTAVSLGLASATIWKIHHNGWWKPCIQRIGFKGKRSNRPALQEIRASTSVAVVLIFVCICPIVAFTLTEISEFLTATPQAILNFVSGLLFLLCPIIRSFLFILTSPVLRKVLANWILVSNKSEQTSKHSGFRMIENRRTHTKSAFSPGHGVTIQVEPHSENEGISHLDNNRIRKLSSVSTVTCEVFCDGENEECTVSISGDCNFANSANTINSGRPGNTDSVLVCIGSSFESTLNSSRGSLSDASTETIISSGYQRKGSVKTKWGRYVKGHRPSAVSLNSLSPLDARYISQRDIGVKPDGSKVEVKISPRKSLPAVLAEYSAEYYNKAPRIAFGSDGEEGSLPHVDITNSLGI